jgi:hypothetical protein
MSFSVQFFARTVFDAQQKLQVAYAPGAVKALIEKALDGIPKAHPTPSSGVSASSGSSGSNDKAIASGPRAPIFAGVLVETHGHIDEGGSVSEIGRFVVRPLYD